MVSTDMEIETEAVVPDIPQWANPALSTELPFLREKGEGQELEFKVDFPQQIHSLSEVIASFATSGGGRILLGVEDDGALVGMPCVDGAARDQLVRRAQGILQNVRPDAKAEFTLAFEQGHTVLCINVLQQQAEPIYYHDGRPYIRDDRISRRATPDEVKALIWKHPSSEYRRRSEEMNLMMQEQALEQTRKADQIADETRRLYMECHDELTRLANQALFRPRS